ncbi:jg6008 [Pararge aegeria aegeria]|uniref:Jg6008 protein n=1 Tax=Pararge aegeria aegeria TaxID=348720 RepID=A0A8S4S8W3_9NEOP|nr:jg6008 [Pararge aegeria aegeria]
MPLPEIEPETCKLNSQRITRRQQGVRKKNTKDLTRNQDILTRFDVTTSYNSMERKNMTYAALPRSEAFHSRLEVQARARNERQRGTVGLRVGHLSLSYLSERCVRGDSFYIIIHLHVFGKDDVQ